MIERDLQAVGSRTRSKIQKQLMPNEEFLFYVIISDRILSRWCTRLIATSERLLTIRHFIFDTVIRGIRLEKIETIRRDATGRGLVISGDLKNWELEFDSGPEADNVKTQIEDLLDQST